MTARTVESAIGTLEEFLVMKEFSQVDRIPHAVRMAIVQEALRKAAEKEGDGRARTGEFLDQIESAADNIIAVFDGDENADRRIHNILVFHKVVPEEIDPTSQP